MLLAVGQLVAFLFSGVQRTTGGAGIRAIGAGQAALREVDALATVVEQLERNVRMILATWVLRQVQLSLRVWTTLLSDLAGIQAVTK